MTSQLTSYKSDETFCKVYPFVLHVEGGYSNDPKDPGGPTMYGIAWFYNTAALQKIGLTQHTVQLLTKEQALQIYYENYWIRSGAAGIVNDGLAYLHLDTAVNCGVGEAASILKQLSFDTHKQYDRLQFLQLVHEYEALRLEYYNHLRPGLKARYLAGWINRMKFVELQAGKLLVVIAITLVLAIPVSANTPVIPSENFAPYVAITDITGTHVEVVPLSNQPAVKKKSFAEKHPKLHKIGRKIRRICSAALPVAEFVGACAQTATLFIKL